MVATWARSLRGRCGTLGGFRAEERYTVLFRYTGGYVIISETKHAGLTECAM
jgi:hypothetical protein